MVEDVLATQPNGFSAEDFVKIMKANGVSNIEMLAVMKGESLAGAYRGTVFKSASTLGKLSGLSRKAHFSSFGVIYFTCITNLSFHLHSNFAIKRIN